jgi:predicted nucleotidyltransferase
VISAVASPTLQVEAEAMPALIEDKRDDIEALCRRYGVKRLDVFGSAIRDDFDPDRSDVDLLVEFEPHPGSNMFHVYMDLRDALARLLGRPVDLVMASAVRNPYVRASIEATREPVYAA